MNHVDIPDAVAVWVKANPILAAILAIALLVVVVVIAIRYGDLKGPW